MKPYRVEIFRQDEPDADDENWLPEMVPMSPVAYVPVLAPSEKDAAATAYVLALGRPRARCMIGMGAPWPCICMELDRKGLASCLEKTSIWSGEFYRLSYDRVVTWFLKVEPVCMSRRALARLLAYRARRRVAWRQLTRRALCMSSVN